VGVGMGGGLGAGDGWEKPALQLQYYPSNIDHLCGCFSCVLSLRTVQTV